MRYKIILLACAMFGFIAKLQAQISAVGFQPKMNFSRHLNVAQDLPKSQARTVENRLTTPGIDAYVDFNLGTKWNVRIKAGVETKGFVSTRSQYDFSNRAQKYHFISSDINVVRKWGAKTTVQPYNFVGITSGYNFKRQVVSASDSQQFWVATGDAIDYNDYDKFNLGFTAGVGLSFEDVLWCEIEYNRDFYAPINQNNVKVYNTVYSVNVGLNLLKLLKK